MVVRSVGRRRGSGLAATRGGRAGQATQRGARHRIDGHVFSPARPMCHLSQNDNAGGPAQGWCKVVHSCAETTTKYGERRQTSQQSGLWVRGETLGARKFHCMTKTMCWHMAQKKCPRCCRDLRALGAGGLEAGWLLESKDPAECGVHHDV